MDGNKDNKLAGALIIPVEERRRALSIPGVMEGVGAAERGILKASMDTPIGSYSPNQLFSKVGESLRWIWKDTGYRPGSSEDQQYIILRICEILRKYYPGLSVSDFVLAFELLLMGELDPWLPRDRNGHPDRSHYQQFGVEYVSRVLRAYRARREGVLSQAWESLPRGTETDGGSPSKDDRAKWMVASLEGCVRAFAEYKYHGRMPGLSPLEERNYLEHLTRAGYADGVEVTSKDQEYILRSMVQSLMRDGRTWDADNLRRTGTSPMVEVGAAQRARRRQLQDAFRALIEDDIPIVDVLGRLLPEGYGIYR